MYDLWRIKWHWRGFSPVSTVSIISPVLSANLSTTVAIKQRRLIANNKQQCPSWEANRFSCTQEIPRILYYQKVHYSIDNSPPPVPIPSHIGPVHASPSHFLNIHYWPQSAEVVSNSVKSQSSSYLFNSTFNYFHLTNIKYFLLRCSIIKWYNSAFRPPMLASTATINYYSFSIPISPDNRLWRFYNV